MTAPLPLTLVLTLAGCSTAAEGDTSDTSGIRDTADTADTADTSDISDTSGADPFTVWLPAATSSAGNDLADRCDWVLSVDYECTNPSPEVRWSGAPADTSAFVLVLDDPDAGDFSHWAIVNVPGAETGLEQGISGEDVTATLPGDAYQLENGFGFTGYLGSCPPVPHVYRWRVWALSEPVKEGLERFSQAENAAEAVSLQMAETCHIYGPKSSG